MKKKNLTIKQISRLLLPAFLLCVAVNELRAQVGKINDGVDMAALATPTNYIYYGHYNHWMNIEEVQQQQGGVGTVLTYSYEGKNTPILWRVMGKENGGDTITLLSEYVLECKPFHLKEGETATNWTASTLYSWLNTDDENSFPSGFTAAEKKQIKSDHTVYAPAYKDLDGTVKSTDDPSVVSPLTKNSSDASHPTLFYLPWGTPNYENETGRRVLWTVGNAANTIGTTNDSIIQGVTKRAGAGLKGQMFGDDENGLAENNGLTGNASYWLRSMLTTATVSADAPKTADKALIVAATEGVDNTSKSIRSGFAVAQGIDKYRGVRPIFRLKPDSILFAFTVANPDDPDFQLDQIAEDETETKVYYSSEATIPNSGKTGAAYKLTVVNEELAFTIDSFDLDEKLTSSSVVYMNPDDTLRFDKIKNVTGTPDGFAYKIVGTDRGKRTVFRYGFTAKTETPYVDLVARNIYPENSDDAGPIDEREDYTAYLWAQRDCTTRSNEGSLPQYFTLKVVEKETPTIGNIKVERSYLPDYTVVDNHGDTAKVTFHITSNVGGKYYYLVDPEETPTDSIALIIAAKDSSMLKDRSGEDSVAMNPAKDLITGIFASGKIAFPKNMADTTLRLYFPDFDTFILTNFQLAHIHYIINSGTPFWVSRPQKG